MTVEVSGMAELKKNLSKLEDDLGKQVKDALLTGGLLVETQAKKNIQEVSSGRQVIRYREGGTKYTHIAASAGESPNTDTGNLIRSISTEIKPEAVFVGTTLKYAESLEFGTVNMKPRPFLHKALLSKQKKIKQLLISAIKGAINASTS